MRIAVHPQRLSAEELPIINLPGGIFEDASNSARGRLSAEGRAENSQQQEGARQGRRAGGSSQHGLPHGLRLGGFEDLIGSSGVVRDYAQVDIEGGAQSRGDRDVIRVQLRGGEQQGAQIEY